AETEVHRVRCLQFRIDRVDRREETESACGATADVRQISVLETQAVEERRIANDRKDDVALDAVVIHSEPAADRGLRIVERRISKSDSRHEVRVPFIKPAWSTGRNGQDLGTVPARNIYPFALGNAIARPDETVVPVRSRSDRDRTRRADGDRFGRIVKRRIEIRDVVLARVERRSVLEPDSYLNAEILKYAPTVCRERVVLLETKMGCWVGRKFAVCPEVSKSSVCEGLPRAIRAVRVECQ